MTDTKFPSSDEFKAAARRIQEVVLHTPLVPFRDRTAESSILLKLEVHQAVNSFKIRGVFNAVASLQPSQRAAGISTVSAGNTAQALAWVGTYFGVPARSLMPDTAPASKIEAVRSFGGTPVLVPMSEVFRFLKEHLWESEPYAFIHPWTNRDVMIGHGSMALEILEDCPTVERVYVPVGGGGLIGGVGSALKALKPEVQVIAVEPSGCAALHASLAAGHPVSVDCRTMCDGVAVPYMTDEMFPLLQQIVDDVILVSEDEVCAAVRRLALDNKIVAEPSGALATAAAMKDADAQQGPAVCLVTGGSIDAEKLAMILTAEPVA